MTANAFPLAWPSGWRRTPAHQQERGRFRTGGSSIVLSRARPVSIADGVDRILGELGRLGASAVVISTNAPLRRDGYPRSEREPEDPGAAVYWTHAGDAECMAIDRYDRLADNLAAIAATIEAMRAIQRHGGAEILKRTFQGFKALPGTGESASTMGVAAAWATLERLGRTAPLARTVDAARMAYRLAMRFTHPDAGGHAHDFQLVQSAAATLSAHFGEKL